MLHRILHIRARPFSTSPVSQVDLSNLYSRLTSWRRKSPSAPVVDPTQQRDNERSDNSMPVASKPRKLKVLGQPKTLEDQWPEVKEFAEFTAWPTNHYRKELSAELIDSTLAKFNDQQFGDVASRFSVVKQVSNELSIAVPDPILSKLTSIQQLRDHLIANSRPFDERQPDAIYLNPEDFVGTNVIIQDPLAERKAEKKKMRELVREAKINQKRVTDELMRSQ